jgi:hypothetical protein
MKRLYPSIGLGTLCGLFGKTRQAYYDHSSRDSDEQLHEAVIIDLIRSVRVVLPKLGGKSFFLCYSKTLQIIIL